VTASRVKVNAQASYYDGSGYRHNSGYYHSSPADIPSLLILKQLADQAYLQWVPETWVGIYPPKTVN
jgi:hypothetical protein